MVKHGRRSELPLHLNFNGPLIAHAEISSPHSRFTVPTIGSIAKRMHSRAFQLPG